LAEDARRRDWALLRQQDKQGYGNTVFIRPATPLTCRTRKAMVAVTQRV